MITFVTTATHGYTIKPLIEDFGVAVPPCGVCSYYDLFSAASIPAGTYVFTDFERLSHLERVLAAEYYRQLKTAPGVRVLNDPARVRTRYGLLRSLREGGFNRFDAYRADGHPKPARFPVFVRAEAVHEPALTDLIGTQEALDVALADLSAAGHPLSGLIVIEYCAAPVAPGVFRRWGLFRIGDRMHLDHVVSENNWNVKWGTPKLATEDMYRDDDLDVRSNRFADDLRRAFDLACIDYGRADFGLIDGQPQVYEINTNPALNDLAPHWSAIRSATTRFAHQRFADCLAAIDTPVIGRLGIRLQHFSQPAQRAHAELMLQRSHLAALSAGRIVG